MEKVIIYGAGSGGSNFIERYKSSEFKNCKILAVVDSDKLKYGKNFYGYKIISPERIKEYNYDSILITSVYINSIKESLLSEYNISEDKIKNVSKHLILSEEKSKPFENKKTYELARRVLRYTIKILNKNNINYFLDYGTLLGLLRDGDIIKWDTDIDISVDISSIESVLNIIILEINYLKGKYIDIDYEVKKIIREKDDITIGIEIKIIDNSRAYDNTFDISIGAFEIIRDKAESYLASSDSFHFEKFDTIDYLGVSARIPFESEIYLAKEYGSWRVPDKEFSFGDSLSYKDPVGHYFKNIIL